MKTTHFGITATALSGLVIFLAPATAFLQDDDHREKGHHDNGAEREMPTEGVAVLVPTKGNEVFGTLTLQQQDDHVLVRGKVHGLKPGKHGFHIHQFGDLRDPEGKSAGGHYNPHGTKHGGPNDHERHPGDLGNIEANSEGVAEVNKKAKGLKLHFVLGRSFVVHAGMDDLKSQPSGDAGPRVAVGVIGFAEVKK